MLDSSIEYNQLPVEDKVKIKPTHCSEAKTDVIFDADGNSAERVSTRFLAGYFPPLREAYRKVDRIDLSLDGAIYYAEDGTIFKERLLHASDSIFLEDFALDFFSQADIRCETEVFCEGLVLNSSRTY